MLKRKIEQMQNDLSARAFEIEITINTPVPSEFMKVGDIPCGLLPNPLIKIKLIIDIRKAELAGEESKIHNILSSEKVCDISSLVKIGRYQVALWKLQSFEEEFKAEIEKAFPEFFKGKNMNKFSIEIRRDWLIVIYPKENCICKCKCKKTITGF